MRYSRLTCGALTLVALIAVPSGGSAQLTGLENGDWRYLGGDAGHTRSSPLNQINASNFATLQVAWIFRGDNFGPGVEYTMRATPIYVEGLLITVMGQRRQVVAIDPGTGEIRWTFREPDTMRYLRSPRTDFGKGVAYARVDGRGVIFISTPAFFLWALDAKTGRPLENWGTSVPLVGWPSSGVVDMIPDLVSDYEPWLNAKVQYDPDHGLPRSIGMITSSSPPIVVNGVVVVLAGHEPSYDQTRIENVPADIQGYDARTGKRLWKFHVVPRTGEPGNETWLNDAWTFSGNMSSWAPAAADPALGLVYIVTNASTYQFYTGHRPGDNLFGGSILALDVKTGKRKWHFQVHHSEQWNYDIPTAPILMDLTVNGRRIPALIQNTKQGLIFAFNRETGEPIWPIEERPVVQTEVPGNYTSKTQPYPTRPEPLDRIVLDGITDEYVIDYTPELKQRAKEILGKFRVGGLYMPPLPWPNTSGVVNNVGCVGGLNIYHPPVADPTTGIMYAPHARSCSAPPYLVPTEGKDVERGLPGRSEEAWRGRERHTPTTGTTVAAYKQGGPPAGLPTIDGLPVYKPLLQGLAAYDMNTGQKLWDIPVGRTPARIRNHPMLRGLDIPSTGGTGNSIQMVMGDLLVQTSEDLRGETETNEKGMPLLHAREKKTGRILASVDLPIPGQYGMMTFMHAGRQFIVVQAGSARRNQPGSLVALTLPGAAAAPAIEAARDDQAAGKTLADQRLVSPVNDLPAPYTRVHPWSELPYDASVYDNRASVIGVAEGPDGNIYVLTRCHRNSCAGRPEAPLMKFSPDGKLLASWGAGLFVFPHNLTIDRQGNVWTTDEGNHVVRKFTATGQLLMTIGKPGEAGGPPALLTSPTGVVVAPNGDVFVTEGHDNSPKAPVNRVSKWSGDGTFIKTWGKTGSAPGEFSTPHVIAMDSRGRLFVGDRNNNRIQIFDQEGNFLDLWYQFGRPSGIVITAGDRMYVADSESFDFHNPGWEKGIRIGSARDGKVEYFIKDLEPTTISHSGAEGIGVDSRGNIYGGVVRRRMLEKFVPASASAPATPAAAPAPASMAARTHLSHVATGFGKAPGGRGLAVTAAIEANAVMLHANFAAGRADDLEQMKAHTRHVLHALAPAPGRTGPGLDFGVRAAADAVAAHIEMAFKAPDASSALQQLGPGVATAARAVSLRARAMADLGAEILAASTAAVAAPFVERLRTMALELDTGRDADGNGRIEMNATEPGLNQLEAAVYSILEAEKLPRVLK